MRVTTFPFSGFYNSVHDSEIDTTLERMFSDRETGCERNTGLEHWLHRECNFRDVFEDYAKKYAERFANQYAIVGLEFDELKSPREYNFSTDRIFVRIPDEEMRRIYSGIDREKFAERARERFTSRSGFISFYDPDIDAWPAFDELDHNQLGTMLEVYAEQMHEQLCGAEFDQWAEYWLMEDCFCNGFVDEIISKATPNINRLFRIHDYLEERKER